MEDIGEILAFNVVTLRKARGWTQEMLAEFSDMSQAAITHIENNKRWPEKETIIRLARAFEVQGYILLIPPGYTPKPSPEDALKVLASEFGLVVERRKKKSRK